MVRKVSTLLSVFIFFLAFPSTIFASGSPVQSNSQYVTPSAPAASDGTSTETISIHLQDADQNKIVGDIIAISSSNDSTALFPKNDQTTDSNGDATFTVTSTTPGMTKITVTDTTSNTVFTDWFSVTFYDASKGCTNVPAAPVQSKVVSNTNTTAILTWIDSINPVNNYLISYGTTSKNYSYGDPNVGAQGTTSFTVGSLSLGTKYYFVVAANNNCGTSGFSNEMSITVGPTPASTLLVTKTSTPTGTPMQSLTSESSIVVLDTPVPSPLPTLPTFAIGIEERNRTFRNLGIGIISAGVLVIVTVIILQIIKKKNTIPLLDKHPPEPFSLN